MTIALVEVHHSDVTRLDFAGTHTVFTRLPEAELLVASARSAPFVAAAMPGTDAAAERMMSRERGS